jgi:hypothetical protein
MSQKQKQPPFRLSLTLPLPPAGVNHLYFHSMRRSSKGKQFMGKTMKPEASFWKENSSLTAKVAMKRYGRDEIFREIFSVDVRIWWRDKRSQIDGDGVLKLPLDSMNGIVYSSDKFALPRILSYDYDEKNPRMELLISCPPTELVELWA